MPATQWSDDGFLDGLRREGDSLADGAVERLIQERDVSEVNRLFQIMRSDNQPLPPDLPPPILEFLERTRRLPAGVDLERVQRGEAVYMRHAFTAALVLLAKSLPEGYQAPCLTEILMISNVAQAAEFYASYSRRHYADAAQNPAGATLARDNLEMLQGMIPRPLASLGLHVMPQIYIWDLMGAEACGRLGIAPVSDHPILKGLLLKAVHLEQRIADHLPAKPVEAFSQMIFQGMIDQQYGGQVEFLIPDSMAALHRLAPGKR